VQAARITAIVHLALWGLGIILLVIVLIVAASTSSSSSSTLPAIGHVARLLTT